MSKVPTILQFELALLWRTLNIIKNIDGLSMVEFYEKYIPSVKGMPSLSLSTYWEDIAQLMKDLDGVNSSPVRSLVGIPAVEVQGEEGSSTEVKRGDNIVSSIPELDYLKHDERIDQKHDPLQLVQNIYGAAAAFTSDASPYSKSVLLSACLALAVKSGRASLMLHLSSILASFSQGSTDGEGQYISIDMDPLKDVCEHLLAHRDAQNSAKSTTQSCPSPNIVKNVEQEHLSAACTVFERDPLSSAAASAATGGRGGACEGEVASADQPHKGLLLSFGKADHGKLGHGDTQMHRLLPTVVEALQDVEIKKTASMSTYSVAIDSLGAVYVWGTGGSAGVVQSAKADIQPQLLEALPLQAKVVDVSCGLGHALFLLHTGRVYSWGNGGNGRLGLGDIQDRTEACPVVLLHQVRVTAVQCGASHSMALTEAGKIYSWGKNTQGQCGQGNLEDQAKPQCVRKLDDKVIVKVAAGWEHSLALTREGLMYSWGCGYKDNRRGVVPPVLGLGHNESRASPELIASIESVKIVNITCGWDHSLALDEHGKVLSWGSGQNGKLGLGTEDNVSIPCYIPTFSDDDDPSEVADKKGKSGGGDKAAAGAGADACTAQKVKKKEIVVVHLSAGCEHTAVLTSTGDVYSWGHGDGGRLGHGNNTQCFVPTKVESVDLMHIKPNGIHCGDKFTMLLATGPSPVKSLHTTGSSADIGGVADAIAADRPADATAAHYFTEVESLLKESVPVDVSETGGKAGDPWPKFSAKALNFQSLDSTQMMGILLLLMAKACMFESGVPLESPLTAAAGAGGGDFNDVVSTFLKSTKSRSGGLALYKASNPQLLGLDRAYAVECADSTFTNLLSLLDSLFARYNDNLSRFVAKSTSETVSDQLSALTIEATVGAGAQGPIVGTAMDASAAATAAEGAIVPPIASAGISVETSELNAQLLVGQFEPLFCALIVFAANIEVFADRCRELHKQRSTAVDGFRVRAKDWRNIQRELGRMAHISLEEKVEDSDGKETDRSDESRLRRRHLSNFDHETEGDEEQAADHGDGDAEYSLGSIESEERRLLQSIARQQQQYHQHHEEYDIDTAEQRQQQHHHHHHRHQQDQQSDDDDDGGGRDYRDEKSSFEGDQDFGADSGDDSFFSGDRSRRRGTGMDESFDHEDDQSRDERSTRPYDTGEYGPRSAVNDAAALAGQVAHLPGAAVTGSSARLRLPADNVTAGEDSQESSVGGDRERGEGAPYLSRGDSPAQSFDSLGYPLDHGDGYDNGPHYVEDEYLSGSGSDSQDSRFDGRRTNQTGNADDDEDMEKYYEEQAQEMENLDLQRAIISSMQEGASPVVFESNVYRNCLMQLDGKPGRFGEGIGLSTPGSAPVIPLIRDVVNSMASKCYLALEALCASAVEDSTVAGKRNNPAALVGSVSEGSGDSSSGGAVESVYLLWEAAQVVTTIGFDALYSEHDQRTVLAQLIRLPSSFLYIVPGIVDGATKENKLHALISSVMLPNEAIFSGTLSSSVAERTENTVDLPSVVSFLEFINSHIRACRDVPVAGAAQLSGSAGGRQNTATVAEHYSVKMFARITSALLELMKSLLQVVFDRVASSNPILNESLGFLPEQPLGPVVAKLFDLVTEIVSSDLEVLTTKLSAFDVSPEGRFHASFTSTVVAFTYSRAMKDFGAIPAAALLPNSIKLLRIFQANYNAYKKFLPEDRDAFNAWLVASFQWVVYHLSGTVNLLLVPPQAISPPTIRKTLLACRALFSAGDVRKYSNGASVAAVHSSLYTWEQQVWSMLSRADVHTISRANSTLSKESSVMSETPLDRVDVTSGVDAALLVAASFVMTAFPIIGTSQSTLWSSGGESIYGTSATTHSKFLSAAIADLSKAFTADKLSQYLKQMHCGDLPTWQNFSIAAQGFLALLHTLCRSQNIPLAALAGLIETLESDSKKNESGRLAAVQGLLNSSTDMISFVSVVLHSFALFLSMLEHIATSGHIANKTAALRALVVTCKSLLGSGYHVLVSCALPLTIVKEALFESLNSSAALTGKLEGLVRSHFSPLRAAMLCALEGNQVHLDARAHLDLTLKPFDKDVHSNSTTASVEATAMLAVSLLCNNLPLSHLAQLCMWEEDCLRNKQFALSLLVFLVESLHLCPEAMRYCAESLQSFVDPLETLEEIAYVLKQQAGDRAGGAALNSNIVGPASGAIKNPGGSAALSLGLKAEQMLVKLDSYLSSKIGSLPTTTASSPPLKAATKSSFGEPSLKQIPDLLTLVRYSLVAQAQFSEQSSAPAVTMTPFTGSLKKASEAIAFLLRARKPEDHSGLSLTDTLAANKYLHLLQSSLAGLTSLQTIDSQQRLIYNVKATQGDKAHERSAFLHALCGVLSPLGGLMKVLVTSFQQHLIFCQAVGAQFLFPSIKPIEHTSPTILANVFTPQGNYTLGFWLYIPPRSVLFSAAVATDSKAHQTSAVRIHLLSRMYECGDVNLIALLDRNPTNAAPCFSLTVHLVVDPSASSAESGMHLEIIIAATDYTTMSRESLNTSANTRTKAVRTMCVKSKPLRASEWISCVIELVQDSVALPRDTSREIAMGAAARALARKNYKTKYQDTTCAALFVNGEMQAAAAMTGGRTALHQNMVLGKIPTKLGISSNEKDQIILTDVFWIPTSIYLASANSGYQKIRNFLSKLASEDRIFQFKKEDLASVEVSARDDFYQNLLPRCPPSLLLETLNNSFHCSSRLLELITSNITTTAAANAIGASNGKADKTIEQALPLNLVPVLCAFSTDIISTGDPRCQEAAIKMLCGIIEVLPPTLALCDGGELEVAKAAIMASSSPAGSAFNAAVQNKTVSLLRQAIAHCFSLMEDFTRSSFSDGYTSVIGPDAFDLSFLKESPYVQSATSNKDIWRKRLKFARLSVERCLRISEWGAHISIDENLLITGFAALLAAVVRKRLVDAQFQSECGVFANILSAGGWSPLVSVGRTAQLAPRRLFLHFDQRTFEQCAFPSTAVVMGANAARPGLWLSHCDGTYQRIDQLSYFNPLLPRSQRSASLATEMVSAQDSFMVLSLGQLGDTLNKLPLRSAEELMVMLKNLVAQPSAKVKAAVVKTKSLHTRSLANQFENALSPGANTPGVDSLAEKLQNEAIASADQSYLELMQEISYLRCLAVQLTHLTQSNLISGGNPDEAQVHQLKLLRATVAGNMGKILSIAVQDPVQAVSAIFSSGAFKGVQLDVLKNLIKEGDISFLEKITLRLWKQYKSDVNPACESGYGTTSTSAALIQLTSLAGEVAISDTKIRALSQFPSVRLLGVALERMTGRWFYECTMLTDGLVQLGWANALFRCEPTSGQGVGDHTHSWAYDGLRCKKWNVSCETYGRRWRLGDTVGALIDMDLLEVRFYLNGEDLGQAFEDFSGYDIFPALSLNVRQCVRLNFGQYKFLHPPDELDGKPFKPVLQALEEKHAAVAAAVALKAASTPNSSTKSPTKAALAAQFSAKSVSSDTIVGHDSEQSLDVAVAPVSPLTERVAAAGVASTLQLDSTTPNANPMTPIRQALLSGMGTPAGAETPSTQMITPAHTPVGPGQALAQIAESPTGAGATAGDPIAGEDAAVVAPAAPVGFSTPPRSNNAGGDTPVASAATRRELQDQDAEELTLREWHVRLREEQADRRRAAARNRAAANPFRVGSASAEEDDGEDGAQDSYEELLERAEREREREEDELLEREMEREMGMMDRERSRNRDRGYERDEDREEDGEDDDEEEEEEELDAEDEHRERTRDADDGEDMDDEEEQEVNNHLNQLRRQALIESLIGMGFPVEWALRAAEHCDASVSESAAITWIIERMDADGAGKMDELEGDASNAAGDEDFDGAEEELDYFMNRHAAAFRLQRSGSDMSGAGGPAGGDSSTSSAQAQVLTQAQHLMVLQRRAIPSDSAILSGAGGAGGRTGLSSGHGVSPGGSPTREETYGLRRALVGEDDALSRSTGKSTTSKGSAARGTGGAGAQATEAQLYDDIAGSAAWNSDHLSPPMLIGQYVVKRRHDQDKQEVLSQVVELDQADMLPIIIACEFSLCVYYARAVLLRAVALAADTSFLQLTDLGAESDSSVEAEEKSADKDASTESSGSTNQVNCRSSGSRAAKLLGMPVLSALLLDSDDDPHVLVDFFKICFKQHVVALLQPDRLLPLISNGNMLGDARDRVPTLSPFVSPNVTKLHSLLARLELRQFQGSEGTLAVEESSIQGLNILSQIVYIAVSCSSVDTASIPPLRGIIQSNSSPISSNLLELQSQLLRNIGVTLSAAETNMPAAHKFVMACKSMLYSLVQDALECLQTASVSKYDRFDWISLSLDRHEKTPDHSSPSGFKSDSSSLLYSSAEGAPPVAYAYWLLRTVLTTTELCNLQRHSAASNAAHNKSSAFGSTSHAATAAAAEEVEPPLNEFSPGRQKNSPYHSSSSIPMPRLLSAFELLTSADTLAKLLQLSSTQNLSLRFCVYDLSALILASVNVTLNQAISKANAEPSVQSPSPQVAASEYYITIAKEKRLLQMFGTRMKAEVLDRRMFTRFTRSVGAFLFQWHLLRRQLGLSSLNYMHEFLMSDLSLHLPSTEQLLNASINSIADLPGADGTPLSPQTQQRNRSTAVAAVAQAQQKWFGLRITQLTSNSVTVDWSLDERIFNVAQLSAQADNEATAQQPLLYEANLYFTAASHMGLETPVLVLSNMEQSGTFHIDDLEADTLYKITISKDNPLNNSSDQEDDENDGEDGGELAMKKAIEMQSRSAAILSYFDNGAAIATPLKDQTDQSAPGTGAALDPMSARAGGGPSADSTMAPFSPSPATLSLKQLPAFPNLPGLQASHVESDIDGGLAFPKKSNKSLSWKESDGELLVVAQDEPESSGNRPEVVLFISTESEEPFKFDSDQMSPNLTVSPHTLTLHNQANKKWSTARASARLTSGLHRWDVHIDRCVSKNIFIGVATRDARLDNYVGCDKHGWAFLANKAVWHNKSKIKAYGELFRTGDTVSVILDLEEGTLSYNLNNKPLGVAMEGLVGPLYPAFSLYNEDDRITVVQVRSATGDGASAGGAGSCAAEKLLERIETLNCLLSVVGEAFRITPPSQQEEEKRQEHAVKVPPFINSVPVTEELGAELLKRWELWKADIPMRSFLIGSDFVTICASASQCSVMSNDLLRLWDTVVMKSELAEVVGVGQHKLWLRSIVTGELFGYTSDTVQLMVEKGMMQIVGSGRQENVDVSSSINQILPMSAWKKSSVEGEQMNTFYSFEVSSVALRDGLVSMQEKWQADDDLALVRFIQTAARKYAESPFDLNIRYILRASAEESDGAYQVGLMETETAALPRSVDVHPLDGVQDTLQILGRKYSQEDVALRVLLLIHLNDLILPLLPVLCPYSNATDENFTSGSGDGDDSVFSEISTEAAINHPTSIIKSVRQLLFSKVKRDFAYRLSTSTLGHPTSLVRPPFSTSTNGSDSAAHPTANSALAVNQHSAVSASGKSDSADEGGGGGAADNRLGGRTLQMLLHSLGEDARKFYDIDDSTPDRSKQSPNVSPFMATGAASESVQQTNISGQPLLTPSTLQDHPSSVTALTPVQSFFRGEAEGSAGNSSNALALTAADSEVGFLGILSSSAPYLDAEQMLVLEVCEETNMSKYVYDAAISKGVSHQLLLDARWNLVCGIQCSYVGQLINYLEQLASLNANGSSLESSAIGNKAVRIGKNVISAQSLHALQGGDAAAWENCLRNVADGVSLLWSCDNLPAKKRNVPFLIRALKLGAYSSASPAEGSSAAADDSVAIVPSKLFQWIAMAERAPGMVSEWSLFAVFVEEACSQVQRVVDGLFAKGSNSCSRSTSQARGVLNATTALLSDPALLNLTLQLFHSTGVLVGMALRAGAPVFFPLPSVFYAILSNSPHVAVGEKKIAAGTGSACHNDVHLCADVTLALALSLRNGIISTFPEPALDLLSRSEMELLLTGSAGCGPPSALQLQRFATYESPLSADDPHVLMFWAAVMELTPTQVRALLKATLPTSAPEATVDEILYGSLLGTSEETAATAIRTGAHVGHKIHIMPPTAVALLSADTSDIVFFPTLGAISLPRFSNLRTMYDQLVRVLKLP